MVGLGMTGPSLETTNTLESPPLNPPRAHHLPARQAPVAGAERETQDFSWQQ